MLNITLEAYLKEEFQTVFLCCANLNLEEIEEYLVLLHYDCHANRKVLFDSESGRKCTNCEIIQSFNEYNLQGKIKKNFKLLLLKKMKDIIIIYNAFVLVALIVLIVLVAVYWPQKTPSLSPTVTTSISPTVTSIPVPPQLDVGNTQIIWRQGAVTSGNLFGTWEEICDLIELNNEITTIYVDNSLAQCIITKTIDCMSRVSFLSSSFSIVSSDKRLLFQDGKSLLNPRSFGGSLIVMLETTSVPNIIIENGVILKLEDNVTLTNVDTNLVPGIRIFANQSAFILFELGGIANNTSTPSVPLIMLESNAQLIFSSFGCANPTGFSDDFIASVDNTSTLIYAYDDSSPNLTFSGYLGTIYNAATSLASRMSFDDTLFSPTIGSNVQESLDYIKKIFTNLQAVPGNMKFGFNDITEIQKAEIVDLLIGPLFNAYSMPNSISGVEDKSLLQLSGTSVVFKAPNVFYEARTSDTNPAVSLTGTYKAITIPSWAESFASSSFSVSSLTGIITYNATSPRWFQVTMQVCFNYADFASVRFVPAIRQGNPGGIVSGQSVFMSTSSATERANAIVATNLYLLPNEELSMDATVVDFSGTPVGTNHNFEMVGASWNISSLD